MNAWDDIKAGWNDAREDAKQPFYWSKMVGMSIILYELTVGDHHPHSWWRWPAAALVYVLGMWSITSWRKHL